jgi:hypothetical protein
VRRWLALLASLDYDGRADATSALVDTYVMGWYR